MPETVSSAPDNLFFCPNTGDATKGSFFLLLEGIENAPQEGKVPDGLYTIRQKKDRAFAG